MTLYVEIAVPLPIEGLFTYSVPKHLNESATIGKRVILPFGKKIRTGFIVQVGVEPPKDIEVKQIDSIPEEPPYFDEDHWKFLSWIANYYMVCAGLVLKTALPPGSDRQSKPWAFLQEKGEFWLRQQPKIPPKFLQKRKIDAKELANALGKSSFDTAVRNGFVRIVQQISKPRGVTGKGELQKLYEYADFAGEKDRPPILNPDQQNAVTSIWSAMNAKRYEPFLLHGVTGSGKTEVYLHAIEQAQAAGRSVLILAPEIALTPQLAERFVRRLGQGIGVFHSGYTAAQRLSLWRRVVLGDIKVVVAARSGIFLPLPDLGLIVVDEEHDSSYKQSDSCPYNARDMAMARAKLQNAVVILGSATPSFETFVNCQKGKISRIDLPTRYHGGKLPEVEVVDLKHCKLDKHRLFTPPLLSELGNTLARKEQAIIFLNRRGFDTFGLCKSCGFVFKCPNCDISLTHHKRSKDLRCHICGYAQMSPPLCPNCQSEKIFFGGIGTQKIEEELHELFPDARIERLDADATRKRADLESILRRFRNREIDILTGTQMIVKGHDFPGISLVGILCGDASLHFPDFRSSERTFQMLTQVSGRTGRGNEPGKVILQTFDPNHYAVQCASKHDFMEFFSLDTELRRELCYPPFGHLILIRIEGNVEKRVESGAIKIGRAARIYAEADSTIRILGPAPSPIKKMAGKFRWQVLLKCPQRNPVRAIISRMMGEGRLKIQGLKIVIDIDPAELM